MKDTYKVVILSIILMLLFTTGVSAQTEEPELDIRVVKNFGYSGFGNDIQGTFTIRVNGPDDLVEVHFYLDDTLLGTDSEPRFALQFQTDNYEEGLHQIYAIGFLADGTELRTGELTRDFVSGENSANIAIWIVGIVLAISLVGVLGPVLMGRRKGSVKVGEYGVAGGAVCGRCGFPFSRNILAPNLVFGKLERCPHCGKWAIARRAFPAELAAAEERYHAAQQDTGTVDISEEDGLHRSLEDSRFDD